MTRAPSLPDAPRRKRISTSERVKIFQRANGICHLCGGEIKVGEAWDASHDQPLAMNGEDGGANTKPAHRKCHKAHTATVDMPQIAEAKRREARNIGAKAPSQRPLKSAGFPKRAPREPKTMPPRRPLFITKEAHHE